VLRYLAYAAGTLIGAAASGIALAAAVRMLQPPAVVVATTGALTIVAALSSIRILPSSPWRVPRSWGFVGHHRYAAAFGFLLGLGFMTARPAVSYWLLLVAALGTGSSIICLVVMLLFGLGRALAPAPIAVVRDPWTWYLRMIRVSGNVRLIELPLVVLVTIVVLTEI
jgi:hypothetical protein